MKMGYTGKIPGDVQVDAEEAVAFWLFENTDMDEEECQAASRSITIVCAEVLVPGSVLRED